MMRRRGTLLLLGAFSAGTALAAHGTDLNGDGRTDRLDLQRVVNAVIGAEAGAGADVTHDGRVDALDVQRLVNGILSPGEPPPDGAAALLPKFALGFADGVVTDAEVAAQYDLVVWHNDPELRERFAHIKTLNPGVVGLMYRTGFSVLWSETPLGESVGQHDWIAGNHPEWFLKDQQGEAIEVPDYPGQSAMDFGQPGWRAFWIERTLRDVVEGGWDGVFIDDALTTLRAHRLPPLGSYATDAALQAAVRGFLQQATEAFHRAGKLVIANVSNSYDYPGLWQEWLAVTDGLNEEHFSGEGWGWGAHVASRQLEALRSAAELGKWSLCLTYGEWTDRARMRDSLAAYLVAAGERAYWSYKPDGSSTPPMWDASWELDLGEPLGAPQVLDGVWLRRFQRGWAATNPSERAATAQIDGRAVTLASHEGLVVEAPPIDTPGLSR